MTVSNAWTPKHPDEVLVYGFDLTAIMDTGEAITSASFDVDRSSPGEDAAGTELELEGEADTASDPIVKHMVSGGTDGQTYRVTVTVETDAGRTLVEWAYLEVQATT